MENRLWIFALGHGLERYVELSPGTVDSDIALQLQRGFWFTSVDGWKINPANVVMFRISN